MEINTILITLGFLFGFFIESIFGFAGTVVSFAILGIFLDIKTLIYLILYVSTVASLLVIVSDKKSFSRKNYILMISTALPGAMIGAFLYDILSSEYLFNLLSILLIFLGLQSFYNPKFKVQTKRFLLFLSGIIHGIFGLGGVVAIGTMKNSFQNKSQLRVTFATFFLSLNLIRFIQYYLQGSISSNDLLNFWWIPLPLIITIHLGHKVHLHISEKLFKKGISFLLIFAGSYFLLS